MSKNVSGRSFSKLIPKKKKNALASGHKMFFIPAAVVHDLMIWLEDIFLNWREKIFYWTSDVLRDRREKCGHRW